MEEKKETLPNNGLQPTPIFLLQSKTVIITNIDKYDYNSDDEALVDDDGNEVTNQALLDREDATETWQTESVWLTREEAEAFGKLTEYRYPDGWRVYCVNAEGDLAKHLKAYAEQMEEKNYVRQ